MMFKRFLGTSFIGVGMFLTAEAQLVNKDAKIFISKDAVVSVDGDVKVVAGEIANSGRLSLTGDWINHSAQVQKGAGHVILRGADQRIAGTRPSVFGDLEFSGTGIKKLESDADVFGRLLLNDREAEVNGSTLTVRNADASAIGRSGGYIGTGNGGKLVRNTNSGDPYLYPFGSSSTGYRPLEVLPQTAEPMAFSASMFNNDPSESGYNVTSKRENVKSVFDRYFYLVDQVAGTGSTHIKFYLSTSAASTLASGADVKTLLNWSDFRLWEKAAPSIVTDGDFGDGLNRNLLFTSAQRMGPTPFTFGEPAETAEDGPLTFFNAFSPDGDGKNDTWTVGNLDLFPENDLTIFNRWGDEVFRTRGYSSATAWDGGTLNPGTYYYVLNVKINGAVKSYKGFITMLKKN